MQLPEKYESMLMNILEDYPAYRDSLSRPWERGLRLNPLKVREEETERVLREVFSWKNSSGSVSKSLFETDGSISSGNASAVDKNLGLACEDAGFEDREIFERIPWSPLGYYIPAGAAPSAHPYFQAGLYYLQEPSAQAPAAELPVLPGDRVLDLCAAPGGKSTQLLAKLGGRGFLLANDPSAGRAAALRKNLELFGAANAFVTVEEPSRLAVRYPGYFDAILVDAPCSGSGMFRKEPSMTAVYAERGPESYTALQEEILEAGISMLRPGGHLMYSTCTFSPEEDEWQVAKALKRHPELSLLPLAGREYYASGITRLPAEGSGLQNAEMLPLDSQSIKEDMARTETFSAEITERLSTCGRLYPHRVRGEGQFLALFRKAGDEAALKEESCQKGSYFHGVGEHLYLLPEGTRPLPGVRYLMTGLCVAKKKGKRLVPTQALAMALSLEEWPKALVLPAGDARVARYLRGETIFLEKDDELREGKAAAWLPEGLDLRSLLVTVDGYPLGFAREQNGMLKNLRDAGWRVNG